MDEPNATFQMQCSNYINSTCKWMKFFGIVMIVSIAFMILAGIGYMIGGTLLVSALESVGSHPHMEATIPGVGIITGIYYIIFAIISVFPTIYLLKAAKAGKAAVALHDNSKMAEFAKRTKSYWKFCGILTIVILSFVVLCIVGGIVAGAMIATAI